MATNLPLNKTQDEVKTWLKEYFPDLEIVYINYCYNITEIVRVVRKLTNLMQMKGYLESYKQKKLREEGIDENEAEAREISLHPPPNRYCFCMKKDYPNLAVVEAAIEKTEEELEKHKKDMDVNSEKDLYCGTAFIVLNKQSHVTRVLKYFEVALVRRAFSFLIYNILR